MENKIIIFLLLLIFINCSSQKTDINDEYRIYQINKGLDPKVKRPFQHFKDFLTYKDSIKKQELIHNSYLKINKVYIYLKNSGDSYIFSIYSDDGQLYTATKNIDSEYLSLPENGIIRLKQSIKLYSLGDFELTKDILKVSRKEKTPFKEWYENDTGYLKNDTIHFTESYISKKYEYKKRWLAKTHKSNFINTFQPNLKATKIKDSEYGYDVFIIKGDFKSNN